MIITQQEYLDYLNKLKNPDFKALTFPKGEHIYNINLNTRKCDAPTFLSVKNDHEAETILFQVDRFFDNMDLSMVNCVIQYTNANGDGYLYRVPFYDKETLQEKGKLIVPWFIKAPVTAASGPVNFSFQFYVLEKTPNKVYQELVLTKETYEVNKYYILNDNKEYVIATSAFDEKQTYYHYDYKAIGYQYDLHTQSAKSQVLHSLGLTRIDIEEDPKVTMVHEIYDDLNQMQREIEQWDIYWEEL